MSRESKKSWVVLLSLPKGGPLHFAGPARTIVPELMDAERYQSREDCRLVSENREFRRGKRFIACNTYSLNLDDPFGA